MLLSKIDITLYHSTLWGSFFQLYCEFFFIFESRFSFEETCLLKYGELVNLRSVPITVFLSWVFLMTGSENSFFRTHIYCRSKGHKSVKISVKIAPIQLLVPHGFPYGNKKNSLLSTDNSLKIWLLPLWSFSRIWIQISSWFIYTVESTLIIKLLNLNVICNGTVVSIFLSQICEVIKDKLVFLSGNLLKRYWNLQIKSVRKWFRVGRQRVGFYSFLAGSRGFLTNSVEIVKKLPSNRLLSSICTLHCFMQQIFFW